MPEKKILNVLVEESTKSRHYWASRPSLQDDTVKQILSSDILIVPHEDPEGIGDTFPAGTADFIRSLSRALGPVAFATEPAQYQELSLRADHVRWPTIAIAASIVCSVVGGVLANEITTLLRQPKPAETLETKLIIENASGKCISISYQGPPSQALETIIAQATACFPEDIDDNEDSASAS